MYLETSQRLSQEAEHYEAAVVKTYGHDLLSSYMCAMSETTVVVYRGRFYSEIK